MGIGEIGATGSIDSKNSSVSRVSFGVDISEYTKQEKQHQDELIRKQFRQGSTL